MVMIMANPFQPLTEGRHCVDGFVLSFQKKGEKKTHLV